MSMSLKVFQNNWI